MLQTHKLLIFFTVIIILLVGSLAWMIQNKIVKETRAELGQSLNAVLETSHQAVKSWLDENKATVSIWSNTPEVRHAASTLLAISHSQSELLASSAQAQLRSWFLPLQQATGYQGYFIIGPDNINLASSRDQNIGVENLLIKQEQFLQRVWNGETVISLPEKSDVPLPDREGQLRQGLPSMFVGSPILNEAGKVIAIFTFRINPEDDFTTLLQKGRIGQTGETYAFDGQGRLISNSRFDDQLRAIGLISAEERGILNIKLRDPGVNLLHDKKSGVSRVQQSFTRMAASAIAGESASDLTGYRDYRGMPVIGAWLWDTQLGFGITTELDKDEAYQTLRASQKVILTLTILIILLLSGITIIFIIYQQRKQAQAALWESEEKYRTLFNAESDLLIVLDQDTHQILEVNESAVQMYGFSREELLQMTVEGISAEPEETIKAVSIETPTTISLRYHKKKDGTVFPVEIKQNPIVYQDRRLLVGVVRDITERLQAEEALRESEQQIQLLIEQADIHLWTIDSNLKFTQSLGGGLKNLGLSPNEVVGMTLYEFFQTESTEFSPIKEHLQCLDGNQVEYETEWQGRFYQSQVIPKYDATGKIIGCIGVAFDTTNRKQAEKAMQRSEVLEHLASGASLDEILGALVFNAEKCSPGALCSVLLLDEGGKHLRHGAAPSLPDFYNDMIDGSEIGPEIGSCHAAAYSGERVIVEDIMSHSNWENNRELAKKAGLCACWSEPVISSTGDILGTFAIYYRESRTPSQSELDFIQGSAQLAGIAIERKQTELALRDSEEKFRGIFNNAQVALYRTRVSDGKLLECNERLAQIFGYKDRNDCINHFVTTEHYLDSGTRESMLSELKKRGEFNNVDARMSRKDGAVIWVRYSGKLYPEKGYIEGVATDTTEQKRAVEALRDNEQKLRLITDNVPAFIGYVDSDLRFQFNNKNYERWFGMSPEEICGRHVRDILGEAAFEQNKKRYAKALSGVPVDFERPIRFIDNKEHYVSGTYVPDISDDGEVKGFFTLVTDITERKQAVEALKEERDKAQRYLDTVEAMIIALDLNGHITLINRKGCELLGYEEQELIGKNWFETCLPQPEGKEIIEPVFLDIIEGNLGAAEYYENLIVTRHGEERLIAWHVSYLHNEDGKIIGALSAGEDITERKLREEELARFKATLDQINDCVFMFRPDSLKFFYVNQSAMEQTGYQEDEMLKMTPVDIKPDFDEESFRKWISPLIVGEKKGLAFETRHQHMDGHNIPVEIFLQFVALPSEEPCFVAIVRDITERKLAEEKERQHMLDLAHVSRLSTMGEMATEIAHELNQPLTSIASYGDTLSVLKKSDLWETEDVDNALQEITKQAHRAADILQHLRSFVQNKASEKSNIDINKLVQEVIQFTDVETRWNDIDIHHDMTPSLPKVWGDKILIEQVILNLIRNAIDAMSSETCIERQLTIQTQLNGKGQIELEVSDTGPGLSSEMLGNMFKPFFTTKQEGMGMGLSICRSIIEEHGGRLWASSQPGKGTTLKFTIPIN